LAGGDPSGFYKHRMCKNLRGINIAMAIRWDNERLLSRFDLNPDLLLIFERRKE
jgi:hypothetical protein